MNESNNTRKFTQKLWNKVKDTFLTKEYVIKGALVGQEWTLFESTVGNSPIVLPPSDSFIELYIEMYSSNNGTITHQKTMRMDSILFESDNMEYREIVLDSMYNAQTYVRYDFATNSIIPTVYEGDEITDSSSDIITTIYTKTNKIEAGSIEAEKIVIDNTTNNLNATNVQGALNEVVDKLNNLSDGNPQDITKEDIGLGNVDNTSDLNKPVSTATQTAIDNVLSESKGYTDTKVADLVGSAPETLNALEEIVQAIEENEDVVTALNSAIGTKANQSDLDELSNIVDTKASQDDLTELQNTVNENIGIQLSEHTSNTSNPHGVTASQLGLDNVDNTSDLDKPVSTATQTAIDNSLSESKDYTDTKVANLVGTVPETLNTLEKVAQAIEDNGDAIETLNGTIESKANQSDLEALSNTVDTKASQDDLAELQSTVNENIGVQLSTHTSNTSNPHGVTASQLGLDNVDNTSDLDKPVSTPQQEAINNSLYESKDYTDTKVAELIGDVIGDDGTELADTLLSGQTTITFTSEEITNDSKLNAVYTSIFDVPLESATFEDGTLTLVFPAQEEDMTVVALINATSFGDDIVAREVMDELNTHTSNTSNPHSVTKDQVGLGNVDNTSDMNKPISTAMQSALDLKASQDDLVELQNTVNENIGIQLSEHTSNKSNPHSVTKAQVGLGNVDNISDINKPVSTAQQAAIDKSLNNSKSYTDTKVANLIGSAPETLNTLEEIATAIEENEDVVTALNSAIGTKANQSDLDDLTSTVEAKANQSDLETLQGTVETKANQSDLETLQSTVETKANRSNLEWHSSNKTNPHGVTKAQVGLGNVDNTSDANKPISTATQTALDGKASQSDLVKLQSTVNENIGVITEWTPNGIITSPQRNFYIKTKNTLKIWFQTQITDVVNVDVSKRTWNICDDILGTFGINSYRQCWGTVTCYNYTYNVEESMRYPRAMVNARNDYLYLEYCGDYIYKDTNIYGYIEIGING